MDATHNKERWMSRMDKTPVKIATFLRVQYVRTMGEKYIRIVIPVKDAEKNDIKPGDLLKINIEEHIKVGRDGGIVR